MQYHTSYTAPLFLLAISLHGCNSTDSTEEPAPTNSLDPGVGVPIIEYEPPAQPLQNGEPAALLENTANHVFLNGSPLTAQDWLWQLVEEGDNQSCSGIGGFSMTFSSNSLEQACTSLSQCELRIDKTSDSFNPEYVLALPALHSSVALTYEVSAQRQDGSLITREQVICALAINEAPEAGDDHYKMLAGSERIVRASDRDSLLGNDFDDIDSRNEPLRIDTQLIVEPQFADFFSLQADGGFIYRAAPDTPLNNGMQTDTFDYSVSDGLHDVVATATISIVTSNSAPQSIGDLPDVQIEVSSILPDVGYEIDVSTYFSDTDGDNLNYYISTLNFSDNLTISINDDGIIAIASTTGEPIDTPAEGFISVIVSDRLADTEADFTLTLVETGQEPNNAPTVVEILNETVQGDFKYDVSSYFSDPDGDELLFSSENIPPDVSLSVSGTLSGSSSSQNVGIWFIVVTATDEAGESVSDAFRLIIN
ncbi:MAG: putative Ig domain-containing protein [Granulosicoccus sp.]